MRENIILNTDSYKLSHWLQYPKNTENVFSYIESRGFTQEAGDSYTRLKMNSTIFFGLQAFLKQYLVRGVSMDDVKEAEVYFASHGVPWNKEGWLKLIDKHNGKLPVIIKAVPEGTDVPLSNVLATVEVTDPEFYWLTSYLETALLRAIWYPTSVATLSNYIKRDILEAWKATSDAPREAMNFKLHDFGARGVSSFESAAIGGAAHLVNFDGTDTVMAMPFLNQYYGGWTGYSIPAAEHSTITTWGREGEADAFANMLETFPDGLVAVVSDSYDIENAAEHIWGELLKDKVLSRPGTVVVRPDSGDPTATPVRVISLLMEKFGYSINSKGFRVLPDQIRVIQGDGINRKSINGILAAMHLQGMAIDNIAFGMGGALLQHSNRDTFQFAMKASAIKVNGEWRDVYKEPKAAKGKISKRGRLDLINDGGQLRTVSNLQGVKSELVTVFENGRLKNETTFNDIKNRVESSLDV